MACSLAYGTASFSGSICAYRPTVSRSTPLSGTRRSTHSKDEDSFLRQSLKLQQSSHVVARNSVRCDAVRQYSPRRQSQQGATTAVKGTARSAAGAAAAPRPRVRKDGGSARKGEAQAAGAVQQRRRELDALETWLCGGSAHRDGAKGASKQRGGESQPLTAPQRVAQPRVQRADSGARSARTDGGAAPEVRASAGGAPRPASSNEQGRSGSASRCSGGNGGKGDGPGSSSSSVTSKANGRSGLSGGGRPGSEMSSPGARRPRRGSGAYASLADAAMAGMTWVAGPEGIKIVGGVQRWRQGEGRGGNGNDGEGRVGGGRAGEGGEGPVLLEHAVVSLQLFLPLSLTDLSLRALWNGVSRWPAICSSCVGAALHVVARMCAWFSRLHACCLLLGGLRALQVTLTRSKAKARGA